MSSRLWEATRYRGYDKYGMFCRKKYYPEKKNPPKENQCSLSPSRLSFRASSVFLYYDDQLARSAALRTRSC